MENAGKWRSREPALRQNLHEPEEPRSQQRAEHNGRDEEQKNFADFLQEPVIKSRISAIENLNLRFNA